MVFRYKDEVLFVAVLVTPLKQHNAKSTLCEKKKTQDIWCNTFTSPLLEFWQFFFFKCKEVSLHEGQCHQLNFAFASPSVVL